MMANGNNEVWTVEYWREKFTEVKANMPTRWRQALANHNSFFNSKQGADMMDQVADGRASLEKTVRVVQACSDYLASSSPVSVGGGYTPIYETTKELKRKMESSKVR